MVRTEIVNLNTKLHNFLPAIRHSLGTVIQVELTLDPTVQYCSADPAQLEIALLNLASNARDAMPNGGTLSIATRNAHLDATDLGDNTEALVGAFIAVAIRDTGSGMTDEVTASAFEPFFTTKEIGAGSGLGLN